MITYTDGKQDSLLNPGNEFVYHDEGDFSDWKGITNTIGNRIIPERVKELVKEELKKPAEERGGFIVKFLYNDRGNAVGATVKVWGDLMGKITDEEVQELYRRLMQEKIDTEGRVALFTNGYQVVEPGDEPRYGTWTFCYVSAPPGMLLTDNVVDLD